MTIAGSVLGFFKSVFHLICRLWRFVRGNMAAVALAGVLTLVALHVWDNVMVPKNLQFYYGTHGSNAQSSAENIVKVLEKNRT